MQVNSARGGEAGQHIHSMKRVYMKRHQPNTGIRLGGG